MNRWLTLVVAACTVMGVRTASADKSRIELMTHMLPYELPPQAAGALAGGTIYLNRCVGGCTVRPGMDNAATDTSSIVNAQKTLPEYTGFTTGEWENVVQCVKEVYSPFNVKVVDVRPAAGIIHEEIMVGGSPDDLGLPAGVGGIASIAPGCSANAQGVSFAFTSSINIFAAEAGGSRVNGLCWIIAQETAHNFGLDHEYEFVEDSRSACNDPMTYRADCGGQKFFRNKIAKVGSTAICGTDGNPANACFCGGNQNSHGKLIDVFGAGTSLIPAPTVSVAFPAAGAALGATVQAMTGSKRGVERLELYLNGWKWATAKGAAFGAQGQANPSLSQFAVPSELPNSTYDIVIKSYDDLGVVGTSPTVTVNKGAACASADTCLAGQKCENGRCFWDPAVGEIGEACTYGQYCLSGVCQGSATEKICTQDCIPGGTDACPADLNLTCTETTPGKGVCFFKADDSGCCSVGERSNAWLPGAFGTVLFGLFVLRRRRRA